MIAEAWQTRVEGPLVFKYQFDSYAHDNLDAIVREYRTAFEQVCAFLSLAPDAQQPITIRLCQVLTDADGQTLPPEVVEATSDEILACASSETAEGSATFELTRLLLARQSGPVEGAHRFWYDGLAGYLAGRYAATVLASAGPGASRAKVLAEFQRRRPLELDGWQLAFDAHGRASSFVSQTMLNTRGNFVG